MLVRRPLPNLRLSADVFVLTTLRVALDRGLRLADKRSLPAPNRELWLKNRDQIYEEVQTKGWNAKEQFFSQSYESPEVLDSSILIMPLTLVPLSLSPLGI